VVPYEITLVTSSQQESPAAASGFVNTYDVLYTATFPPGADGQPRLFSDELQVPKSGTNPVSAIQAAVEKALAEVEQIYALGGVLPA